MKFPQERKVEDGVQPFLDDGERLVVAIIARPRGSTQSTTGSAPLGTAQQQKARAAADQAGLRLANPMALALTQKRVLTFRISTPIGFGIGGSVQELVGAVAISDTDAIDVTRLILGFVVTVTVRGIPIKLEAGGLSSAKRLAAEFNRLRVVQHPAA
jgi:hypothetical protein